MKNTELIEKYGALMGRILIGIVYLASGVGLLRSFQGVAAMMTAKGIPAPLPILAVIVLVWLVGGTCVILGWRTRLAATALFVLSVPVVLGIHWPWAADPRAFTDELNHFLQGLAMLGGLAYLVAFGPGELHIARAPLDLRF